MLVEMVLQLILWSGELVLFRKDADMLCGIILFCLGSPAFGRMSGLLLLLLLSLLLRLGAWPYSVRILVKWVAFLGSLHWPAAGADLWVGGVSFGEVLAHFV